MDIVYISLSPYCPHMHRKTIPIYQALEYYLYTLQYSKRININVPRTARQPTYYYILVYNPGVGHTSFWYGIINEIARYRNCIWDNSGVLLHYA